jgi:hypothetical protein
MTAKDVPVFPTCFSPHACKRVYWWLIMASKTGSTGEREAHPAKGI